MGSRQYGLRAVGLVLGRTKDDERLDAPLHALQVEQPGHERHLVPAQLKMPSAVVAYIAAILRGTEARFIGHNPAGGAMIVALMGGMVTTALSGWLMTTDAYFGDDGMQMLHTYAAHTVLVLVLLHLAGVALASFRHRENLVAAMISGRKRGAGSEDIA